MTQDELGAKLNELRISPETAKGKVVELSSYDRTTHTSTPLENNELVALGLNPEDLGYVDEHPEGSDRGGYVPFLKATCDGVQVEFYYYEPAGEWYCY